MNNRGSSGGNKIIIHQRMRSSPDDDEADGVELPVGCVGSANTRSNEDEYIVDLDEDISNDENDDEFISSEDVENTNGESRLKIPFPATSRSNSYEYRTSVRRQNCFFGISVLSLTMAFIATYLFMGLSFTPANIGIFGDESSRKGGSGKVKN